MTINASVQRWNPEALAWETHEPNPDVIRIGREARAAFNAGVPLSACPYADDTKESRTWRFAWSMARRLVLHKSGANRRQRAARYGLTEDEYRLLERAAGPGGCTICGGATVDKTNPAVDHDHDTLEVRGLLCRRCNAGLGYFGHDPARLEAAAAYLRNPPGATLPTRDWDAMAKLAKRTAESQRIWCDKCQRRTRWSKGECNPCFAAWRIERRNQSRRDHGHEPGCAVWEKHWPPCTCGGIEPAEGLVAVRTEEHHAVIGLVRWATNKVAW